MKRLFLILFAYLCVASSCFPEDKADNNRYEIEMAEIGEPGTLVVKVWCYNKKPQVSEAVAKMNAIKGVLFKGVQDSGRMKGRKPLVPDGYENHKDYFDDFFKEEKFNDFSRIALNNYVEQNSLIKVGKQYKIGKIVVISYNDLRKQLESDNIIKRLDSGF